MKNTCIWAAIAFAIAMIGVIAKKYVGEDPRAGNPRGAARSSDRSDRFSEQARGRTRSSTQDDRERESQNRRFKERFREEAQELKSLPANDRREALLEMIAEWTREDPANAMRYYAKNYGAMDFAAAKSWIDTIEGIPKEALLHDAITGLLAKSPEQAAHEITALPLDPSGQSLKNRLVVDAVGKVAHGNPMLAASLIEIPSLDSTKDTAANEVMKRWIGQDPAAARAHIEQAETISEGTRERILIHSR